MCPVCDQCSLPRAGPCTARVPFCGTEGSSRWWPQPRFQRHCPPLPGGDNRRARAVGLWPNVLRRLLSFPGKNGGWGAGRRWKGPPAPARKAAQMLSSSPRVVPCLLESPKCTVQAWGQGRGVTGLCARRTRPTARTPGRRRSTWPHSSQTGPAGKARVVQGPCRVQGAGCPCLACELTPSPPLKAPPPRDRRWGASIRLGPDPSLLGGAATVLGKSEAGAPGKGAPFRSSRRLAQGPLSSSATCEVEVWMGCSPWPHSNTYPKL